jgi:hypothetical protein
VLEPETSADLASSLSCSRLISNFPLLGTIGLAVPHWQLTKCVVPPAPHLTTNQQLRLFCEQVALRYARCILHECEAFAMARIQNANGVLGLRLRFAGRRAGASFLDIEAWMPSETKATPADGPLDATDRGIPLRFP